MAVVECIPEKKQTPSAQKGVIDYCIQPSKTFDDDEQLAYVSGYNCIPELANESFLVTQKIFGIEPDGVRFYHYVQSFRIGEELTPQEAHEIGMEFAKSFGNREVLVATHIDREHIHNHLVVCAYDLESGIKLHNNKFFLGELRDRSDEICMAHGLSVLEKYDPKKKSSRPDPKEYRAAVNGNSWKIQLCVAIDHCMKKCKSKAEFKREMKKLGYDMVWTPERKYITYILRGDDGKEKRVRDIKLHEEKYRKENMENEFRIRAELYGQAQSEEYTAKTPFRGAGRTDSNRADQPERMGAPNGSNATLDRAHSRFEGAEGEFEARSGRVYQSNDDGSTGADTGSRSGDQRDFHRSYETGWESERESLRSDRPPYHQGRGDMVASAHTHGAADDLGLAVMGMRGLHDLGNIIENDNESEEEKREREARNAGSALGAVVGIAAGLALGADDGTEDVDENEYEDEDEGFDITM
jgi:hypothetical protein